LNYFVGFRATHKAKKHLPPSLCVLSAAQGPSPRGKGMTRVGDREGVAVVEEATIRDGGGELGRCGGPRWGHEAFPTARCD